MARNAEAVREGLLEEANHIFKVGRQPDQQRGGRENLPEMDKAFRRAQRRLAGGGGHESPRDAAQEAQNPTESGQSDSLTVLEQGSHRCKQHYPT